MDIWPAHKINPPGPCTGSGNGTGTLNFSIENSVYTKICIFFFDPQDYDDLQIENIGNTYNSEHVRIYI